MAIIFCVSLHCIKSRDYTHRCLCDNKSSIIYIRLDESLKSLFNRRLTSGRLSNFVDSCKLHATHSPTRSGENFGNVFSGSNGRYLVQPVQLSIRPVRHRVQHAMPIKSRLLGRKALGVVKISATSVPLRFGCAAPNNRCCRCRVHRERHMGCKGCVGVSDAAAAKKGH